MEKQYTRVTDIDEKIKNVSLPYFYWKVLFLVLEETSIEELTKTLNSDEKTVKEALDSLEQQKILEVVSGEEVDSETDVADEIEQSEKETDAVEELLEEEEEEQEEISAEIISESEEEIAESEEDEESDKTQAELIDEDEKDSEDESELVSEVDQNTEEIEEAIEKEFDSEEHSESEEVAEDKESEEIDLESISEFEEETETEVDEEKEENEEETTDISSFIDEMGEEEESEVEKEETEKNKEEEELKEKPKEKTSTGSKTVLVIDDSIVIRKMVEIALEDGDYNIVTSSSGKDGLNLLDDENPDLVIVDMTLPDMNGIDLLKTVKASKGIPVIMLSGKDAPQQVENAKNAGADDFLPKPFRDDDLIEKVKNLTK